MLVPIEAFYLKKGQSDLGLLQRSNFLCSGSCKAPMFCSACMSHISFPLVWHRSNICGVGLLKQSDGTTIPALILTSTSHAPILLLPYVKKCLICLGLPYVTNSKIIPLQELFKIHQSKALRYSSHQILPFIVWISA